MPGEHLRYKSGVQLGERAIFVPMHMPLQKQAGGGDGSQAAEAAQEEEPQAEDEEQAERIAR